MALLKSYTRSGFTYPESYWKLSFYSFDYAANAGRIIFNCYADKDCRIEGLGNVLDIKDYTITNPMTVDECYIFASADSFFAEAESV